MNRMHIIRHLWSLPLYVLALPATSQLVTYTISKEPTAKFRTVQAVFDLIPLRIKKPTVIYIKNGSYKEKMHLDSTKDFVTLVGEDKFATILTYDDHAGKP